MSLSLYRGGQRRLWINDGVKDWLSKLTGKPVYTPEAVRLAQDRKKCNKFIVVGANPGITGNALSRSLYNGMSSQSVKLLVFFLNIQNVK